MEFPTKNPFFGIAGFPPNFLKSPYRKKRENIFEWLQSIGLNWIELQNTYGVKMKDEQAYLYKELAKQYNIGISLHGPYYITLASADRKVVERSKERILQCVELATKINSTRIIFHPGHFPGASSQDREEALEKVVHGLNSIANLMPDNIHIYPETAGKKSQLGSIEDIIYICSNVKYTRPCIDVAHTHAFEGGSLTNSKAIIELLNLVEKKLGRDYLESSHFHMYPVEIDHNGEKKHKAFTDRIENQQLSLFSTDTHDKYFPLAEDFVKAIKYKDLSPVVICEARDTQDSGALLMKNFFYNSSEIE